MTSMKRLYRSNRDKVFTGICGGLGEYLNIDATLVRLLVVVGAFVSLGTVLLIYLIAIFIIPQEPYAPS